MPLIDSMFSTRLLAVAAVEGRALLLFGDLFLFNKAAEEENEEEPLSFALSCSFSSLLPRLRRRSLSCSLQRRSVPERGRASMTHDRRCAGSSSAVAAVAVALSSAPQVLTNDEEGE